MWLTSGGFPADYFRTARGGTFAAAGLIAIVAFVLGMFVARPLGVRIGSIAARVARTDDPDRGASIRAEMAALQKKILLINVVLAVLLVGSPAGMAIARYVG